MSEDKKRQLINRILIIGVIVPVIATFLYFELYQYLTLPYLKESQALLQNLYQTHQLAVIAGYMAIYIAVTAMSLPGAAVLTLAGGGLFGLLMGTLIVSFASTIGATLACIISRFLLRDWVQNKFGDKLHTINQGMEKEGSFYLFSLRLVPLFPFFVINLVMGLTKIPLLTYFWVSQVGMLAGTIVYVNAGKELAKIETLAGIMSPGIIASFVVLGLFPLTVKKLLALYKTKTEREATTEQEKSVP